ncbi:hypothetical protein Rhopal_004447-T1 [Rhodotorula paludigena]|uniref:Uncharacterized protein n=1 Tax=Rhodotorula paludigena TaxID=86838 RepID=A0AAV5GFT6_9BASI|nr:hypothetical protein Rhopal_004447-T1 [Rhodotorula paludigena]
MLPFRRHAVIDPYRLHRRAPAPAKEDVGIQSDSEADDDSGNEQAASGDNSWDAVRHPEYEKIHRRDVDPLFHLSAPLVLRIFEDLYRRTTPDEQQGEDEFSVHHLIDKHHKRFLDSNRYLSEHDIYVAWLYFASDSGRLPSELRMKYNRHVLGYQVMHNSQRGVTSVELEGRLRLAPLPARHVERTDQHVSTWGECVHALEWFRRFCLEDPAHFLIVAVFRPTLGATRSNSTDIGIKDALSTHFKKACIAWQDQRAELGETPDARIFLLPGRDALFRGFLCYMHGSPSRQRARIDSGESLRGEDPAWARERRAAVGLPGEPGKMDFARIAAALSGLSWAEWKARVFAPSGSSGESSSSGLGRR